MGFFDWFKRKLNITPDQVDDPDPAMREIASRVFNSGVGETGTIDKNRKVTTTCRFDPATGKPLNK